MSHSIALGCVSNPSAFPTAWGEHRKRSPDELSAKVAAIEYSLHGGGFETVSRDRLTNSLPGFSACRVFSDSVAGETGGKI